MRHKNLDTLIQSTFINNKKKFSDTQVKTRFLKTRFTNDYYKLDFFLKIVF